MKTIPMTLILGITSSFALTNVAKAEVYSFCSDYMSKIEYVKAVIQCDKEAQKGGVSAAENMGVIYDQGFSLKEDDVEAYKWYLIAVDGGNVRAKEHIQALDKTMSQEQIYKAKKMSEEWLQKYKPYKV